MSPESFAAQQALQNARLSIRNGERQAARRWAEKAAALDPGLEEAWLILAAVASPRASLAYLERALQINPESPRALQGLAWARQRLGKVGAQTTEAGSAETDISDTRPRRRLVKRPVAAPPPASGTSLPVIKDLSASPAPARRLFKPLGRYRWPILALGLLLLCVVAVGAFWPGNASPALAFLHDPAETAISGLSVKVNKPTYTATFTPSPTFTPTPTYTPTFTATYTPTETPLPTLTFTPTETPWPTSTPFQPATEEPVVYDYGNGVHWIDVDLSQQMLYAYEGNTIVASFLVSTGVPAFPTVVGQFHVYMKFEYTLMAGDGYYLPDVPYTMYFYKGYGIHGTYWHNNFGTPMSHGCVNMYTPDAQWLYYWAPMGILVNVHY
jgi:lipoprotein-anchoring transpeptidase ErfK/SrfK